MIFRVIKIIIKKYINKKKTVEQVGKITIKADISVWMSVLATFSSLFAVVALLVVLLLLDKGNLDILKYFIIFTGCIHVFILVLSSVTLFRIFANKKAK